MPSMRQTQQGSEVLLTQPHPARGRKIGQIAMARKLAVRLYWMMRKGWDYEQMKKFGSHAGEPGNRDGVQLNTE